MRLAVVLLYAALVVFFAGCDGCNSKKARKLEKKNLKAKEAEEKRGGEGGEDEGGDTPERQEGEAEVSKDENSVNGDTSEGNGLIEAHNNDEPETHKSKASKKHRISAKLHSAIDKSKKKFRSGASKAKAKGREISAKAKNSWANFKNRFRSKEDSSQSG